MLTRETPVAVIAFHHGRKFGAQGEGKLVQKFNLQTCTDDGS